MSKNEIKFTIGATGVDKATSDVKKFQQTTTREMTQAEKSVASSIGKMIAQYASLAVAINEVKKAITTGIDFNQFKESQETAFTVMMKSADKAKAKIEELRKFSITNPLTFKETIGSSKQLLAYGFDADELVPTIERLGTVALATGNKLDDVAYVFGTLRAQGRAYSRDLMQFGTRGIPIYDELSKVLGVSVNQVQKLTSQGEVGFREVEKAFINMTSEGGRFDGLLNKFMDTAEGKASQLGGMWKTALGDATKGLAEQIKRLLDSLTDFVQSSKFNDMMVQINKSLEKTGKYLFDFILFVLDNLPAIIKLLKTIVVSKIGKAIYNDLKNIPSLILSIAEKMTMLAVAQMTMLAVAQGSVTASSLAGWSTTLKTSLDALKTSLVWVVEGVGELVIKLIGLINPLTIIGSILGAGIVVGFKQNKAWAEEAEANKASENHMVRMNQLTKDFSSIQEKAYGSLWQYIKNIAGLNKQIAEVDPSSVEKIAKEYNLTTTEVARALQYQGLLTQEAWNTFNAVKATNDIRSNKMSTLQMGEWFVDQTNWMSTLEALGISKQDYAVDWTKSSGLHATASAILSGDEDALANAYLAMSKDVKPNLAYQKWKVSGSLPTVDDTVVQQMKKAGATDEQIKTQTKEVWEARLETINKIITDLLARDAIARKQNIIDPSTGRIDQNEAMLKWLLEQARLAEDALGGTGSKAKELLPTFKELDKWWLPDESRVKATVDAFDDIELIYEKALYNANAEIDARKAVAQENYNIAETVEDQFYWAKQVYDIEVQRSEIMKNITKEAERQRDASKFNVLLSGNSEYFKDKQAKAFKAYEGTTVSGGVPVSEKIAGIYDAYKDDSPMQMLVHGIRDFYNNITSFDIKGSFKEMWDSGLKEGVTEQAKSHLEGTEVGSIMSTKGLGVVTQMVAAFMEMLMSIENVNKVLNPFATIFESMKNIIEPFVNSALKPIVNILEMIGEMLGKVLAPIISGIQIVMSALYVALLPLNIIISVVGEAFAWFNDHVIYPLGNALIDTMNAVIKALNKIPFVSIKYIDRINKVSDALDNLAGGAQNMQSSLSSTINYLTKKLNALVDKQVESARSLYEVGAITGAEYEAQIAEMNRGRLETDLLMISKADQQIEDAQGMLSRLYELALLNAFIAENQLTDEQVKTLLKDAGLVTESQETMFAKAVGAALDDYGGATAKGIEAETNKIIASIHKISNPSSGGGNLMVVSGGGNLMALHRPVMNVQQGGVFSRDVGSGNIPYDHLALVHKGEGIVPATFMEAIRSGELSLSGRGAGSGVTVVVNVEGSVQAENNLADTIAEAIYTRRSRGLVTV